MKAVYPISLSVLGIIAIACANVTVTLGFAAADLSGGTPRWSIPELLASLALAAFIVSILIELQALFARKLERIGIASLAVALQLTAAIYSGFRIDQIVRRLEF